MIYKLHCTVHGPLVAVHWIGFVVNDQWTIVH